MIETPESRAKFEREAGRNLGAAKISGEPVGSGVKVEHRDRAAYMRGYRRRRKKCPHCGKAL
jgi:hypothetical protein